MVDDSDNPPIPPLVGGPRRPNQGVTGTGARLEMRLRIATLTGPPDIFTITKFIYSSLSNLLEVWPITYVGEYPKGSGYAIEIRFLRDEKPESGWLKMPHGTLMVYNGSIGRVVSRF